MPYLTVPAICEQSEMRSVEEDIEKETPRAEQLPLKPIFAHRPRVACTCMQLEIIKERRPGPARQAIGRRRV